MPKGDEESDQNQGGPEQNYTLAAGGVAAASTAPLSRTPAPQPELDPFSGEPANDNAWFEGAPEGAELAEGVEELAEGAAVIEGAEVVGALLAPEIVIPILIITAILVSSDDPKKADTASEEQPDEDVDNTTKTCPLAEPQVTSAYKPLTGEGYSDQTSTNAERADITARLDAIKERLDELGSAQPPKTSYNVQLINARDQKTRDKILKRQQDLCRKLNDSLKERQELPEVRQEMQSECFNSPKTTDDEKTRDDGHKKAIEETETSIENLKKEIAANC